MLFFSKNNLLLNYNSNLSVHTYSYQEKGLRKVKRFMLIPPVSEVKFLANSLSVLYEVKPSYKFTTAHKFTTAYIAFSL